MNAIDTAITTTLSGDNGASGVFTLTDITQGFGGIHKLVAPQRKVRVNGTDYTINFPRLHFQELLDTALYSFRTLIADHCYYQFTTYAVDGQQDGITVAGQVAERARTVLTDPAMSVTGKVLLYSRFERSLPDRAEWDDTNSRHVYSKGFILELWLA